VERQPGLNLDSGITDTKKETSNVPTIDYPVSSPSISGSSSSR
jgi:hypothetical protein